MTKESTAKVTRVRFTRVEAGRTPKWEVENLNSTGSAISGTKRSVGMEDTIKLLAFDPAGGQKQFQAIAGEVVRVKDGNTMRYKVDVQLNLQATTFVGKADLVGDMSEGLTDVDCFIVTIEEPIAEAKAVE